MSNRNLRLAAAVGERRISNRLPIEQDVRYKVFGGKLNVKHEVSGRTLNISSGGILFTTESSLPAGARLELSVSWPARLDDTTPLKLVAMGILIRSNGEYAAMSIERYEFKTRGTNL